MSFLLRYFEKLYWGRTPKDCQHGTTKSDNRKSRIVSKNTKLKNKKSVNKGETQWFYKIWRKTFVKENINFSIMVSISKGYIAE